MSGVLEDIGFSMDGNLGIVVSGDRPEYQKLMQETRAFLPIPLRNVPVADPAPTPATTAETEGSRG